VGNVDRGGVETLDNFTHRQHHIHLMSHRARWLVRQNDEISVYITAGRHHTLQLATKPGGIALANVP
jgi:hypothetical protein